MTQERLRLISILLMCFGGSGSVGVLLGWALRGRPVLAAVMSGLVLVGGALAW